MPKRPDIITLDCYGTLIDWESGISDAFIAAAASDGVRLDRESVLREYSSVEPVVESERYRTYREVLRESAARAAHALGWPIAHERAGFLAESLPSWRPFADTNEALRRFQHGGVRLAILSNTDADLISAARRHLEVDFDFVITAQQVRSYKPGPPHFLAAREQIGPAPWIHTGASIFHDVVPAKRLGISTAWVNRKGEPVPEAQSDTPLFISSNLRELADLLL